MENKKRKHYGYCQHFSNSTNSYTLNIDLKFRIVCIMESIEKNKLVYNSHTRLSHIINITEQKLFNCKFLVLKITVTIRNSNHCSLGMWKRNWNIFADTNVCTLRRSKADLFDGNDGACLGGGAGGCCDAAVGNQPGSRRPPSKPLPTLKWPQVKQILLSSVSQYKLEGLAQIYYIVLNTAALFYFTSSLLSPSYL